MHQCGNTATLSQRSKALEHHHKMLKEVNREKMWEISHLPTLKNDFLFYIVFSIFALLEFMLDGEIVYQYFLVMKFYIFHFFFFYFFVLVAILYCSLHLQKFAAGCNIFDINVCYSCSVISTCHCVALFVLFHTFYWYHL